jgi:hypothetical protein
MRNIFRMAAFAAAIAAIGFVGPVEAKPKHKQGHHAHAGQVHKHYKHKHKHRHARRHSRGPEHRYSGASTVPPGWVVYGPPHGWYGSDRPPGWNRGAKRGWQGRPMPPGQYRKHYRQVP